MTAPKAAEVEMGREALARVERLIAALYRARGQMEMAGFTRSRPGSPLHQIDTAISDGERPYQAAYPSKGE